LTSQSEKKVFYCLILINISIFSERSSGLVILSSTMEAQNGALSAEGNLAITDKIIHHQ
jgi:hypothetical protein